MVALTRRIVKLKKRLYNIRCGDGAALLPSNITKIHLTFPVKKKGGYDGARMFWRHIFPRMKYYNPNIKMMVSRPTDVGGECLMRIYVKRSKEARFLPSKQISDLNPQRQSVPLAARPIEQDEDWVPALPHAFPPPNVSHDEDLIEIPMRNLAYQHVWEAFKRRVPTIKVENSVAMNKDVEDIEIQRRLAAGAVEGEAGKRWLDMFKKEMGYARELEKLRDMGAKTLDKKLQEEANSAQQTEADEMKVAMQGTDMPDAVMKGAELDDVETEADQMNVAVQGTETPDAAMKEAEPDDVETEVLIPRNQVLTDLERKDAARDDAGRTSVERKSAQNNA